MSLLSSSFALRQSQQFGGGNKVYANAVLGKYTSQCQLLHDDGYKKLSKFWAPTSGVAKDRTGIEDSHSLLLRGGFIRQAYSGLYHFLPLGLRVQEKLERLLDKHMVKLGASKVSLSTFSSEDLWKRSGRLGGSIRTELFRLKDRKESRYLLSPTHEEEITTLVGGIVNSYRELPLRLYQISRKYRDEPRPRQGLLRTREFLMKDLYTFDHSQEEALRTYSAVRRGYSEFFDEFKIPYVVAEADSGSIGGNLSHEYHFPTPKGEDNVISCDKCDYVANEELARTDTPILQEMAAGHSGSMKRIYECRQSSGSPNYHDIPEHMRTHIQSWYGISDNGKVLFQAILPATKCLDRENRTREARVNPYAIKSVFPDADLRVESQNIVFGNFDQLVRVFDYRVSDSIATAYNEYFDSIAGIPFHLKTAEITSHLDVTRIDSGDLCPVCTTGTLRVQTAVELGHTFFLGTRYSEPLQASIASGHENLRSNETSEKAITDMETLSPNSSTTAIQMGCHGIGVSRIIAAVADSLADETGLNWPRVMAPFEVVVIPANGLEDDALEVLSRLDRDENTTTSQRKSHLDISAIDAILDDRKKDMSWKLKDADLIGYPVIIVLGRAWRKGRVCEVQCRRLKSLKVDVHVEQLNEFVSSLLDQL